MSYLAEFRTRWRLLLAATLGLSSGLMIASYTTNIFSAPLITEFGWTKSEFAIVAVFSLIIVLFVPITGRLVDVIGVRRTALIGVCALPISYLAFGAVTGDIRQYIWIYVIQVSLCMTTTGVVYGRTVIEQFKEARGFALAVAASGPAVVGAIGVPLLNNFVEAHGWRAGFHALAAFSVVVGGLAILMLPRDPPRASKPEQSQSNSGRRDYALIVAQPAFWILLVAMSLFNVPQVIWTWQLKLVMLDRGVTPAGTSIMLAAFANGVLLGRFACGWALDRFSPNIVGFVSMAGFGAGMLTIAAMRDAPIALAAAAFLMGLSQGDFLSYLIAEKFGIDLFGSVIGLVTAATVASTSLGAVLLSFSLKLTGTFTSFLFLASVAVLFGAVMILFIGGRKAAAD